MQKVLISIVAFFVTVQLWADKKFENVNTVMSRVKIIHFLYSYDTGKEPVYTISSIIRDSDHNEKVGGAKKSAHLDGKAIDIQYDTDFLEWFKEQREDTPNVFRKVLRTAKLYIIDKSDNGFLHYTTRKPKSNRRIFN